MSPTLTFIYNEVIGLSQSHEVLLITTYRAKELEKNFPFDKIKIIPFIINRIKKRILWFLEKEDIFITRRNNAFRSQVSSVIENFKPDVIHTHFGNESMALLDNLARTDIPVFVTFHGYDASYMLKRKKYIEKLNEYSAKYKYVPICVSMSIQTDLKNAGVEMRRGKMIHCGIDTGYFIPPDKRMKSSTFTFLQIGSFTEKKGQIYTVRAFKKFLDLAQNKEGFRLVFGGTGKNLEKVCNECTRLGLDNYIEFKGAVTVDQAYKLLCNSNVFVHHAVTVNGDKEGIPTAIMEAMAMELPVISTRHAGIPELVEDGINGFLISEKDVDTYAKKMHEIAGWNYLKINRDKILEQFSLQIYLDNLLREFTT